MNNQEVKLYTKNDGSVIGIVKCINGVFGECQKISYKSVKNAIRYQKLDEKHTEIFNVDKIAALKTKREIPMGGIAMIMASCTTLKERLKHVYTPILLQLILTDLIESTTTKIYNVKSICKHIVKKNTYDLMNFGDQMVDEIKFNLRNNDNVLVKLGKQKVSMCNDINMPIQMLIFAFDSEIMKQAPTIEYHKMLAELYTIYFICNYINAYDKMYDNLISKRTGLPYYSHKDKFIEKIKFHANNIMVDICKYFKGTIDFNGTKDKLGINNVEIARKSLDNHICNSSWLDSLI